MNLYSNRIRAKKKTHESGKNKNENESKTKQQKRRKKKTQKSIWFKNNAVNWNSVLKLTQSERVNHSVRQIRFTFSNWKYLKTFLVVATKKNIEISCQKYREIIYWIVFLKFHFISATWDSLKLFISINKSIFVYINYYRDLEWKQ